MKRERQRSGRREASRAAQPLPSGGGVSKEIEEPNAVRNDLHFDGFISYSHRADDMLAPRLQAGLQQFAKPWWRRRAIRMFRDESSLSANPHLWTSIEGALRSSDWFVLLLSPEAASSQWVDREVSWWAENKDPNRILPVLTEGEFVWDETSQTLHPSSSVPPSLLNAFTEEPRWVDLRWARTDTELDLRNTRFRSAIADIASAVRNTPKDDLESEEVRQHRRTKRTAWAAGISLALLAALSTFAAFFAFDQRNEARAQTLAARSAASVATRLDLGLLLAVEGYRTHDSLETRAGLLTALNSAAFLAGSHPEVGTPWAISVSRNGSVLAALSKDGDVTLWDPNGWQQGATLGNVGQAVSVAVSADGTHVAAGGGKGAFVWRVSDGEQVGPGILEPDQGFVYISPEGGTLLTAETFGSVWRLAVWTVTTGEMRGSVDVGEESAFGGADFSPDGSRILVSSGGGNIGIFDTSTLEPILLEQEFEVPTSLGVVASPAGGVIATGSHVPPSISFLDAESLEPIGNPIVPRSGGRIYSFTFSPGGERLLAQTDDGATAVIDVASGLEVATLVGRTGFGAGAFWLDSNRLVSATSDGGLHEWDMSRNTVLGRVSREPLVFDTPSPGTLATLIGDQLLIDWADGTRQEFTLEVFCAVVSLSIEAMIGALGCEDQAELITLVIDLNDGHVLARHPVIRESADDYPGGLALSPDGRVIGIAMPRGQVMAIDSITGDVVLPLTDLDPWAVFTVGWAPDGSFIAAGQLGKLIFFDPSTWTPVSEVLLEPNEIALRDLALHPDGRRLFVASESGYVWIVDLESMSIDGDPLDASGTQLQGVAVSGDGSMVAASSRDGAVRLWETESRRSIGPALQGHRLAGFDLAFGPAGLQSTGMETIDHLTGFGDASTIYWTLEPDILTQTACALVGRNLTRAEWAEYVPDPSYRVTCPQFPAGA